MPTMNSSELLAAGRELPVPFQLEVKPDSGRGRPLQLEVVRLFRLLPGNRLVGLTRFEDEPALLKLFFQPHHFNRHLEREQRGNRLLMEARVSTPPLLDTGLLADGKGAFQLTRYLADARSLLQLSEQGELALDSARRSLVEKTIALLSRCHEKGIWQNDIHLDNFLLHEGRIYFLDGADVDVETLHAPLGEDRSLENLAWFFAQFSVAEDAGIDDLFHYYLQCRSARQINCSAAQFRQRVQEARRQRLRNYRRKLLRATSAHAALHEDGKFLLFRRNLDDSIIKLLRETPDLLVEQGRILKAGNTSTVVALELAQNSLVLKRYNLKNLAQRLRRWFRRSRAERSWCNALQLEMLGIPTAQALAMLEERSLGRLRGRSFFLARLVEGANVAETLAAMPQDGAVQDAIMDEFGRLFAAMRTYRFTHGDMKATNFIYAQGRLQVLDLDAMQWHEKDREFQRAFAADLKRFVANWENMDGMAALADKAHNVTAMFAEH